MPTATLPDLQPLIAAQGQTRVSLTDQAMTIAADAAQGFTGWYSADQITAWAAALVKLLTPILQVLAVNTDAYMAQAVTDLSGRRLRPVGPVDVTQLRRGITQAGAYARAADVYRWQQSQYDQIARLVTTDLPKAESMLGLVTPAEAAAERVQAVANTDTQLVVRAQAQRTMQAGEDKGFVTGWRRVIHPELAINGTCGLCVAASDRIYKVSDLQPIHARCITGDTVIAAAGVSAITRRNYSGALVILTTASGKKLRVTPNHPVLTDDGWVPAGFVGVGDNVLSDRSRQRVVGGRPDEDHRPTTVEQVWRSATMDHGLHSRTVPLASEDFHGDGTEGEVDVVTVDGFLPNVGDVSFIQPAEQLRFMPGGLGRFALPRERRLQERVLAGAVAAGSMGRLGEFNALAAGRSTVAALGGQAWVSELYALLAEARLDRLPGHLQAGGDGEQGLPGFVPSRDRLIRQAQPDISRFDPAFAEFAGQGRLAYAGLGRDLGKRLAGGVEADRVVDKRWVEGSHAVYNLQTREGWYSAGGFIVSNCNCIPAPILDGRDPGSLLNAADLTRLYKDAGSTGAKDLKRSRYQVSDHSELGPVLNDGTFRTPRRVRESTRQNVQPKTPAERRQTVERIHRDLTVILPTLQDKAHESPKQWGAYVQNMQHRIAELEKELAA